MVLKNDDYGKAHDQLDSWSEAAFAASVISDRRAGTVALVAIRENWKGRR